MTPEETLKEIPVTKHCRNCLHFLRVNFEEVRNVMNRQGFCILGNLKGDYGLYVSFSCVDCMGYIFSQEHDEIHRAEQALKENERVFCESIRDRRSKNYKLIEPLIKETQEYINKVRTEHVGYASMLAMREVEITAHKFYRENNKDEYMRVYKMVSLRKPDYNKFLAKISVAIHDEFCKCDHMCYNPEAK